MPNGFLPNGNLPHRSSPHRLLPITIDCQYFRPQFAAAFLITQSKRGIFVENNTTHSIPLLLKALQEAQVEREAVDFLMVTHVHLDHAGGSSSLIQACPNAVLLAHPKAATHLIDPTKLVKSAKQVYGEQVFEQLYGTIEPIPASRVRVMQDNERLSWQGREFTFFYTRGHANHHFCIYDSESEGVFTGDTFGLAYPALQKHGLFIFPSTSPTDFDPNLARESIQKILSFQPKRVFLTHFGEVTEVQKAADQLLFHINFSEKLLNSAVTSTFTDLELDAYCEKELQSHFKKAMDAKGLGSDSQAWELVQTDLKLNAAGIAHVARKKRKSA